MKTSAARFSATARASPTSSRRPAASALGAGLMRAVLRRLRALRRSARPRAPAQDPPPLRRRAPLGLARRDARTAPVSSHRVQHAGDPIRRAAYLARGEPHRHPRITALGKALGYLHRQWHRLVLFLTDGRLELTNNRLERELRALVLGRKNWLFAYGDLGGKRTAMILTVIGTCIAHRINPRAYLHAVAKLIVNGFPSSSPRAPARPDRRNTLRCVYRPQRLAPPPALPAPS